MNGQGETAQFLNRPAQINGILLSPLFEGARAAFLVASLREQEAFELVGRNLSK